MIGPQLRRTGFAAVLVTGLALTGSAVQGIGSMETSLQLAVEPESPRTLVDETWCPEEERTLQRS